MPTNRLLTSIVLVAITLIIALGIACNSESAPTPTLFPPAEEVPGDGGYAGLSLGANDNSIVNIHMVYPSQEAAEKLAKKHMDRLGWRAIREVRTVKVKYSKVQLDHWREALWNDATTRKRAKLSAIGTDVIKNRIYLGVLCGAELEQAERSIREGASFLGIPQDAFEFEVRTMGTAAMLPEPPYDYDCLPAEIPDPITGLSRPGFGGFYYERGRINVYLLDPSQEIAEKMVLAFYGRDALENLEVRAVRGQYTWEQLQRWYRRSRLSNQFPAWIGACEVDNKLNRIALDVSRGLDEEQEKGIEAALSVLGIPSEAVVFDKRGCW